MWGNCDGNLSTPSTFYGLTTPRNQYKRREGPKVVSNIFSPPAELENETFRLFALGGFGPGLDTVDAADEPEFGGEPESGQSDEHDAPPFTPRRRRRQIGGQQKPTHNDDDARGDMGDSQAILPLLLLGDGDVDFKSFFLYSNMLKQGKLACNIQIKLTELLHKIGLLKWILVVLNFMYDQRLNNCE